MEVKVYPLNNQTITISFGENINSIINQKVQAYYRLLLEKSYDFIVDLVPTYTNVTVFFDSSRIDFKSVKTKLIELTNQIELEDHQSVRVITIPVYYNGEDLTRVAEHNGLSEEEVVHYHSSRKYLVYMIGFLPGFPYLGGLDSRLTTPRLSEPRQQVDSGSVGIADQQTGIYPISSPGGWNIIGHSPVQLFDLKRDEPFLIRSGDFIQFEPISLKLYEQYSDKNDIQPTVEWLNNED
ncbi:5-oxoprolinase subunit PxpB [Piscibacillus halophilus]|uniref:Inhibitor of KinA n=1 Tax=Piscibacillus halophilus TaxID=571933 RepID=A0A1H9BA41_9BACI|nr:5-oxoprolinase subunit PxpB [Piscibacillus halophilus]SEP85685.1 inhibitor of KinA [Piscibacillus halophilus]